jgi:hypothetical protein
MVYGRSPRSGRNFPAKIRHVGLLPIISGTGGSAVSPGNATSIVAVTRTVGGVWFPIGVTLMTFVVGGFALKETRGQGIWHEVDEAPKLDRPSYGHDVWIHRRDRGPRRQRPAGALKVYISADMEDHRRRTSVDQLGPSSFEYGRRANG